MGYQKSLVAAIAATGLGLGGVLLTTAKSAQWGIPEARAAAIHPLASLGSGSVHTSFPNPLFGQANTLLQGVLAPLNSLRIMQRAIAASPESNAGEVPTLALLNAPLKTTGLGPIRIGMSLAEVNAAGFTLNPLEEAGNGSCQFFVSKTTASPLA
ncbi:MAG: hypothetical protein HC922_03030 [Leptolyngbyaceae cyanobacterium SM2_3_12]|nr:hypothetical protein [Leptolyngbyaceae cyanobacterium SM2_3_12]